MAKHDRVHGPYLRGALWRVIIVNADGSRSYSTFESRSKAEAFRQGAEEELAAVAGLTFSEAIDQYEPYMRQEKGGKARAVENTIAVLRRMFRDGSALVSDLRTAEQGKKLYEDLRAYRIPTKRPREAWKTYAVATHRNTLSEAKTFLNWCVEKKFVPVNALKDVGGVGRRKKGRDKIQLTMDEARKFMDAAVLAASDGDEGALAGLVALLLAIRSIEIVRIVVRDIDNGGSILRMPESKTSAGEQPRNIATVLRPLIAMAMRGKSGDAFLFGDGKLAHDRGWVRKNVKRICRLAHVPEVTAHALKRTHGTLAAIAGETGEAIARTLGHESLNVSKESYIKRGAIEAHQRNHFLEVLEGGRDRKGPQHAPDDMSAPLRDALTEK